MRIQISRLAAFKTQMLLKYLVKEWSVGAKNRFLIKMNTQFESLKKQPKSCIKSDIRPELRRLVITKQTSVLYAIREDVIFIVTC